MLIDKVLRILLFESYCLQYSMDLSLYLLLNICIIQYVLLYLNITVITITIYTYRQTMRKQNRHPNQTLPIQPSKKSHPSSSTSTSKPNNNNNNTSMPGSTSTSIAFKPRFIVKDTSSISCQDINIAHHHYPQTYTYTQTYKNTHGESNNSTGNYYYVHPNGKENYKQSEDVHGQSAYGAFSQIYPLSKQKHNNNTNTTNINNNRSRIPHSPVNVIQHMPQSRSNSFRIDNSNNNNNNNNNNINYRQQYEYLKQQLKQRTTKFQQIIQICSNILTDISAQASTSTNTHSQYRQSQQNQTQLQYSLDYIKQRTDMMLHVFALFKEEQ